MSFGFKQTITVISDTTGVGSADTDSIPYGRIHTILFNSTAMSTTVDITVTTLNTSQTVWAQSNVTSPITVSPRQATHTTTGGQLSLSTTGGSGDGDYIYAINERIRVSVAQAGDEKAGTFTIIIS